MTLVEHLEELRYRIFICVGAYVVMAIVAYFVYKPILSFMLHPLRDAGKVGSIPVVDAQGKPIVFVTGIATGFILRLKTSAFAGVVFALPVFLYQLWRFITPGLQPKERKFAIPFVVAAVALFALGGYIAFLLLPIGIHWLLGFVAPARPLIHLTEYMSFVFLSSQQLGKARRGAILGAFVIAAVATPSQDPISQVVMAVPLYILYELSILVIRYGLKR
jgi:sec-independent protein translocase protein TatC